MSEKDDRNILGAPLQACSTDPMTGFFRDGCCRTGPHDRGRHVVCSRVTEEFLLFSRARGNDLMTPFPQYNFPGLKPGDQWCLCASRWQEALQAGVAPRVVAAATHERALEICDLADLMSHAIDVAQA
ncbi:MAG: DUF2237 domain-containing protein [Myxococcota bacterium]